MASLNMAFVPKMAFVLVFSLALIFPFSKASPVICEELPRDSCAFAISTESKRCVLESARRADGTVEYQCRTSEVVVERMADWIETDECVNACGVDRSAMGISSDSLLEPQFAAKICSPACFQSCPNIVDLYFNLAAGEGVFLPDLCAARRSNPRRSMVGLLSSGAAAVAPASALDAADAPASPPAAF